MTTRDPVRHIIGTGAVQIGAIATPLLSPLIIGGLIIGLNIGEIEAGSLITVELLVLGITSILIAPFMARIPHHLLAIAASLVLILSLVFSTQADGINELYLWRGIGGMASGCLIATANAAIAQARSPTLLYGVTWSTAYLVTAIMTIVITETNDVISFDVIYAYLAIAFLLLLPLLWFVPRHGGETTAGPFPMDTLLSGCVLSLGITLIGVSMMAYYAFLGQFAVRIDANAAQTGWIIATAQLAGIIGGLTAAPLSNRMGVIKALVLTTLLHVVAIALAVSTQQIMVLGFAAFCEAVLFIIMTPLMFTLAAQIDNKGRWAAAVGGVYVLSTSLGPVIGAMLMENYGPMAIAWLQVLAALPAVYLFVKVHRRSSKAT
ncbi:MAG: putative MFS family arabinose efflux permease [Planctomycetota bacterium]